MKIGQFISKTFKELFEKNLLNEEEIKNLKDKNYSKRIFNISYPVLIDKNENRYDKCGRARYWADVFDEKYYVCNDWYGEDTRNKNKKHRENFLNWYNKILNSKN